MEAGITCVGKTENNNRRRRDGVNAVEMTEEGRINSETDEGRRQGGTGREDGREVTDRNERGEGSGVMKGWSRKVNKETG